MSDFPEVLPLIVQTLDKHLAEEIRILNVADVSSVTDYFVIANGTGFPHLRALISELDQACKHAKFRARRKGGGAESGWMIVDFADVIVHVMTRELREFYALEQLWSDGKTIEPGQFLKD